MFIEKLGNKLDGFDFDSNENIKNKIKKDLDNFTKDLFKKNKNITIEELKNKIDDSLKDGKNPDYSKKKIFLKTFLNKRDEILNGQESYLKEEEKKKQEELERLRQ
jgi:hypothetical protein